MNKMAASWNLTRFLLTKISGSSDFVPNVSTLIGSTMMDMMGMENSITSLLPFAFIIAKKLSMLSTWNIVTFSTVQYGGFYYNFFVGTLYPLLHFWIVSLSKISVSGTENRTFLLFSEKILNIKTIWNNTFYRMLTLFTRNKFNNLHFRATVMHRMITWWTRLAPLEKSQGCCLNKKQNLNNEIMIIEMMRYYSFKLFRMLPILSYRTSPLAASVFMYL